MDAKEQKGVFNVLLCQASAAIGRGLAQAAGGKPDASG
jgi:hypothetical protein